MEKRHKKEPSLFDWQPWLWWCHMEIEAASHILYERVAFVVYVNIFYEIKLL
jgi:hypothetical protein